MKSTTNPFLCALCVLVLGLPAAQSGALAGDVFVSGTATLTLDGFGNPSSQTFSGTISGSGGLSLRNLTGTQILSGANTYTGPTAVSLGTLRVNAPGSLTSNSAVTVAANATLGGTGTVNGPVTVTATLAPGASVGTLTTGAVTFQPGSTFACELADWNGTTAVIHWDLLASANITFNNTTSNKLTIRISGPPTNFSESNKTFTIATAAGSILNFNPAAITINATGLSNRPATRSNWPTMPTTSPLGPPPTHWERPATSTMTPTA